MKVSIQTADSVRSTARRAPGGARPAPTVSTVDELAAKLDVRMDEVRRFTERALLMDEDPRRKRQLRDIGRRVRSGAYSVPEESLLDMAERRAIADRSAWLEASDQ